MNTLAIETTTPTAESVTVTSDTLPVELTDRRSLSVPLDWFPRLVHATQAERKHWRLIGRGRGIRWDLLDEDIGLNGLFGWQTVRRKPGFLSKMADCTVAQSR